MSLCSTYSVKRENFVKNSSPRCFISTPRGHVSRVTRLCQILVVFLFFVNFSECHPWKYDTDEDDGDKDWQGLCDSGRRQSPVDLTKKNCVTTSRIEPIAFIHYNRPVATNVTNNGHTVVLKLDHNEKEIGIAAGGLYDYYILDSVHFHWGGSEHTFNGHRLKSEIHFVHYSSRYDSLAAAKDQPSGLAVVAVIINKTTEDNPILNPLIASLGESIDKVGDAKTLEVPLSAQDLLPTNRSVFYRYAGSLTTPPCSESVEWSVMYRTVGASERQLEKFRTVNSDEGRDIKYNYRPTQPQHDRKIFFVQSSQNLATFQDDGSTASRINLTPWVLIVVMGFMFKHY